MYTLINSSGVLLKRTAHFTLFLLLLLLSPAFFLFGWRGGAAFTICVLFSLAALFLLSRQIAELLKGEKTKLVFKVTFIFRLALFAILIYLMLVVIKAPPVSVILGLALPLAILLGISIKT